MVIDMAIRPALLNLFENRVEIFPTDLDLADALIGDGTISLPPAVVILAGFITVDAE